MPRVKQSPAPWRITPQGWVIDDRLHIIATITDWPPGLPLTSREIRTHADGMLIVHSPELLRMVGGLRLVLDATSMYAPASAQPGITTFLDSSARLLRAIDG